MTNSITLPCPSVVRSRYFTLRFGKWLGRFLFNRRMVWLLAIVASLVVLFYQYENWNGARELQAARAHMIARTGTDDFRTLLPAVVPEEENFFAIPVIKSWLVPDKTVPGILNRQFPGDRLLPEKYDAPSVVKTAGRSVLDLAAWEQKRLKAGKPLPAGQSAASVLCNEIGDGHGIIPQLIAGLDRPKSQMIPCLRASIEASGGDFLRAQIPVTHGLLDTMNALGLHLRAAALSGDAAKTRDIAGVMLRLSDAFNEPQIVFQLIARGVSQVTLDALNEGLGCRSLTDSDFRRIQEWLGTVDDVAQTRTMFCCEILKSEPAFAAFRSQLREKGPDKSWLARIRDGDDFGAVQFDLAFRYGPSGWYDTNRASFIESALLYSGGPGDEGWRAGLQGAETVGRNMSAAAMLYSNGKFGVLNPRRCLGIRAIPNMSSVWSRVAHTLFHRRCAILTCALRRHRLAHGSFPASLTDIAPAFLPAPQTDPAKAGAPMGYRPTEDGFLLWSAGDDRNDDGGDPDKDWLWIHRFL
jgi:hypothetical protein